jgi:hypothetical protein
MRLDIAQRGTAGKSLDIRAWSDTGKKRQFEALATLAGKALEKCIPVESEMGKSFFAGNDRCQTWYRALSDLSKDVKPDLWGEEKDREGNSIGIFVISRIEDVVEASANLCLQLEAECPIPQERPVKTEIFNISNSTIALLNTGDMKNIDSIAINILELEQEGKNEFAYAIKNITEAVSKSDELVRETKTAVLEQLAEITNQARLPVEGRMKPGALKAVISTVATTLSAAGGLAAVWSTWGPSILALFALL